MKRLGFRPDGTHWRHQSEAQAFTNATTAKFRFDEYYLDMLDHCVKNLNLLNEWERGFVLSMKARAPYYITMKQSERLHDIHEKARRL